MTEAQRSHGPAGGSAVLTREPWPAGAGADVLAGGAVLWRPGPDGRVEVALVHRPRYDDWSLPKGKLDAGESLPFTAVREIAEETGYTAHLGAHLGDVHYRVEDGTKLVRFWSAMAGAGSFTAGDETDDLCWLDPAVADERLSYPHDRGVLARFVELGPPASVLVLVRHAKAGSRRGWDGPDALRPLSGRGHEQAAQLARLLPLFGPDRVLSAPPVRCRDTVAPAAAALGLPVLDEPLLGEEAFDADPAAVLAAAAQLATRPGVTVACSQGGVLPAVLAAMAADGSGPVDAAGEPVKPRKASTWVLTFPRRTVDHYPRPTGWPDPSTTTLR